MPDADRRHRIEHCGFLTDDHIARMKAAGVYPAPQPVFIYDFGDLYYSVLGAGRPEASYPMRGLVQCRPEALGVDRCAGVRRQSVPEHLHHADAQDRQGHGGRRSAGALRSTRRCRPTPNSARSPRRPETRKGRLAPGLLGDVAVFSRDMTKATPEEILEDTRCDLTIRGGTVVFDRHGELN